MFEAEVKEHLYPWGQDFFALLPHLIWDHRWSRRFFVLGSFDCLFNFISSEGSGFSPLFLSNDCVIVFLVLLIELCALDACKVYC
jgi:hypothetical protein